MIRAAAAFSAGVSFGERDAADCAGAARDESASSKRARAATVGALRLSKRRAISHQGRTVPVSTAHTPPHTDWRTIVTPLLAGQRKRVPLGLHSSGILEHGVEAAAHLPERNGFQSPRFQRFEKFHFACEGQAGDDAAAMEKEGRREEREDEGKQSEAE